MENNKQKGNSKEFQAEEIDKRFEMDSVNPILVDPHAAVSHPLNDALPGPIQPTIIVVPPQSSGW